MAEHSLDIAIRYANVLKECGVGVPKVVDTNPAEAALLADSVK